MKSVALFTFILAMAVSPSLTAAFYPTELNAPVEVQASANFNSSTNNLEISMQSNGKSESILVYVSRSNGTVVHFEYVTITNKTTYLKINLSDEGTGAFNLRLHGNTLQHSYAFKKSTP